MKDYTTQANVEKYLLKTIDVSHAATVANWIKAMSLAIDNHTNRDIYRDTPETLKYDGNNNDLLVIRDCVDITEVRVDGVILPVFEYPTHKTYTSRIVLEEGYRFTAGRQNVEVDAIPAMNKTLPEDIQLACTIMVAGLVKAQILGDNAGVTKKIGNFSITYPSSFRGEINTAFGILSGYRRIAL